MAYSPAPALRDPTHQAYLLLRVGFVVLPTITQETRHPRAAA